MSPLGSLQGKVVDRSHVLTRGGRAFMLRAQFMLVPSGRNWRPDRYQSRRTRHCLSQFVARRPVLCCGRVMGRLCAGDCPYVRLNISR